MAGERGHSTFDNIMAERPVDFRPRLDVVSQKMDRMGIDYPRLRWRVNAGQILAGIASYQGEIITSGIIDFAIIDMSQLPGDDAKVRKFALIDGLPTEMIAVKVPYNRGWNIKDWLDLLSKDDEDLYRRGGNRTEYLEGDQFINIGLVNQIHVDLQALERNLKG